MAKNYAIIKGNKVAEIIVIGESDVGKLSNLFPNATTVDLTGVTDSDGGKVGVGHKYASGVFYAPTKPQSDPVVVVPNKIVVTDLSTNDPGAFVDLGNMEITCAAGTVVSATVELQTNAGVVVPLTEIFRMPIVSIDGHYTYALASFVDGIGTIVARLDQSGLWTITEEEINKNLPDELKMDFETLSIYVILPIV